MGRTRYTTYVAAPDLPQLVQFVAATLEWTAKPAADARSARLSWRGEAMAIAVPTTRDAIPGMLVGFQVEDLERTTKDTVRLGGQIAWRYSSDDVAFVIALGRTGELFAIEQASNVVGPSPAAEARLELWTSDLDAAVPFYAEVLGWTAEPRGHTAVFRSEGATIASVAELDESFDDLAFRRAIGRVDGDAHRTQPHWMQYCAVRSMEDSLGRCRFFGGKVVVPPAANAIGAPSALVRDPQGAHIGLREVHG